MVQQWDSGHIGAAIVLSGSPALTATSSGAGGGGIVGTELFSSPNGGNIGFYWEVTGTGAGWTNDNSTAIGIGNASYDVTGYLGKDTNSVGVFIADGWFYNNGKILSTLGLTAAAFATAGGLMGLAWDVTHSLIYLRIGTTGAWNGDGAANPATQTGGATVTPTAPLGPGMSLQPAASPNNVGTAVFAQGSWQGSPPSGFGPFDPSLGPISYRRPFHPFLRR